MKIIFLGTNGWYATETGNTPCILLDTDDYYIILDAGNGIYKIDEYIKTKKPIYLFISHFHLEHIFGLHILAKFKFNQTFKIYGKKGTKNIVNLIVNDPFTVPVNKLPYKVVLEELDEGKHELPFHTTCKLLPHSDPSLGYRFELDGKTITYCTDMGPHKNVVELAKDADVFISECSLKSGHLDKEWPHMNPEEAAKIAKKANVKQLILTHFDATEYKTIKEREEAQDNARKIFENTVVAFDDMKLEI